MSFYQTLVSKTQDKREYLLGAPLIGRALDGSITLQEYVDFLTQAYHHVKHTVPLLMTVGGRLPAEKEWLRDAIAEYVEEELGHQEWVLNDIEACGGDKEAVRNGRPAMTTEMMVSYAYDTSTRINPVSFFGMVFVLEGTSINLASRAADTIQAALKLPNKAFTYLRSHGSLDIGHMQFFESLMNRIDSEKDKDDIIHAAKTFFVLYGNIFHGIGPVAALAA
jgi:pyrroloquinoline quinone (PQQ) biosynthesis protein C